MNYLNKLKINNSKLSNNRYLYIISVAFIIIISGVILFVIVNNKLSLKSNFSGGVLALNTDKSEYLPGETVTIQATALNKQGHVACDANLQLDINGNKTQDFKKSSTCGEGTVTNNPDYFYEFVPQKSGIYKITLTNLDSKSFTQNVFKVVSDTDIVITRQTAIRIAPEVAQRYQMKLVVTAKKDFTGTISDLVPAGMTIPWQGPASLNDNDKGRKTISWKIDLKSGETRELLYDYSVTSLDSVLYQFGGSQPLNKEDLATGAWQVVSEAGE